MSAGVRVGGLKTLLAGRTFCGWLGEPDWVVRWGSSCEGDSSGVIMHGGPVGNDWFQMRRFFA